MLAWNIARTFALGVAFSAGILVGCGTEEEPTVEGAGGGYGGGSSSGTTSGSSSGSSSGGTSTTPMLVDVDPNRTMTATPGAGVGVFTQYQTGGHWSIWWTCDTTKTGLPCAFDITVSVMTGTIANAAGQSLAAGDTLGETSSQQIEVQTDTTTTLQGVTFDTVVPAGTTPIITLDAKLNGVDDPSYLFFVQDGAINGNYTGNLTDPLMLEPSSP
jgi:hypothetical protein